MTVIFARFNSGKASRVHDNAHVLRKGHEKTRESEAATWGPSDILLFLNHGTRGTGGPYIIVVL